MYTFYKAGDHATILDTGNCKTHTLKVVSIIRPEISHLLCCIFIRVESYLKISDPWSGTVGKKTSTVDVMPKELMSSHFGT